MKKQIEIRSVTGAILFTTAAVNLAAVVMEANNSGANLQCADLRDANLRGADLCGANLHGANLYGAKLHGANLHGANLHGANLQCADLYGANLCGADLCGANLHGANLHGANLYGANLHGANLYGAKLHGANLYGADLYGAKNAELVIAQTRILPQGTLIGWKKCRNDIIVELEIPAKAKRSHAFGRKCRAQFAKVIKVHGGTVGISQRDGVTEYRKGKIVKCDQWCDDYSQECAGGIHFYITREEAEAH